MTKKLASFLGCVALVLFSAGIAFGDDATPPAGSNPNYWQWAATPPMGWNSYDGYGDSVTEAEILANARYVKDHLRAHGWTYVVVDYRWYDPDAHDNNPNARVNATLAMDNFGRLMPAVNRFPSAADGNGFKPLADQIHAMGLKFGIHIMRGIPRLAARYNYPIEGTKFTAWDAIGSPYLCTWCADMFGVNESAAAQAYDNSILRLYAQWGVDFIKVDDLSRPYSDQEIAAYRKAIDNCGRPIVFSTSPGETPVDKADHIMHHANMWRASDDFWDNWPSLNHAFDLANAWKGIPGPGHWPDLDMIPVAQLSVNHRSVGPDRMTQFSHDELTTLMSLWALAPSPLMLGGNLTAVDDWTQALMTNDEVIAVNQDALGKGGVRIAKMDDTEAWAKDLKDGTKAVGLFNRGASSASVMVKWSDLGLSGKQMVRNLWTHQDLGGFDDGFTAPVPSHGAVLLKITKR